MSGPFPQRGWGRRADEIALDTPAGMTAANLQEGVEELNDEVVAGKTLGELFVNDNPVPVGIPGPLAWTRVLPLAAGELGPGVAAGADVLVVTPAGLYAVEVTASVQSVGGKDIEQVIDVNGTPYASTKIKRHLPLPTPVEITVSGFVRLVGGESVGAMVRNLTDGTDLVVIDCNLKLNRVGD